MKIVGNKVLLRTVEEQDYGMLQCLIHDPEIVKITRGYGSPVSCTKQTNRFSFLPDVPGLRSIIADREHPETGLGIIMLSCTDLQSGTAQIYIKLIKSARGRGYGRDAVDTLVAYAFHELGLHHIYSSILEHNTASRSLFEACGFQLEAVHKSRADKDGHCRKVCSYGIDAASGLHSMISL